MKKLIAFFIDNYKFSIILMLMCFVIGLQALLKIKAESYPAVNFAAATVITSYRGASAEEIETQITRPVEDEIRTVRGLKDVRSVSQSGLSTISIRVDMDNFDVDEVMDDLQKAITRVTDLPRDLRERPKFTEINSEEFPAIELAVIGDNEGRKRDKFVNYLKDLLEDNKMVLGARLTGFREREFSVFLHREKLEFYNIGINEVVAALQARNLNIPSGNLKSGDEKLLLKLDGLVTSIEELKDVYVRSNFTGQKIQLKDIAAVEDYMEEETVLTSVNGEEATLLVLTKKAGEDTIKLVEKVESQLKQIALPEGLSITIYNNESKKVSNRMDVLTSNALSGLALVVIFLLIFLPGRIGIVSSLSLPISMMITLGFMMYMDYNINAITVLALIIALGMLVDNSVVIAENYTRLRLEGLDSREAAIKSADQFWLPITCTVFTTVAAFIPMLVTKGVMGQFIKYIPIIVSISLLASLIESFFLLPVRLHLTGKGMKVQVNHEEHKKDWFHKVTDKFEAFMYVAVKRRYLVGVIFGGVIFVSLFFLVALNKFILFPAEQTEIYISRFETKRGTPVEETSRIGQEVTKQIKEVLGSDVENIVVRSGVQQIGPNDPQSKTGDYAGMIVIYMTKEASFNLKYYEVLKKLREIKNDKLEVLSFESQVNGPPVGKPVNFTLRSQSSDQLNGAKNKLLGFLKTVKGVVLPSVDEIFGEDEVKIDLDFEKLSRLNLSVSQVGNAVKAAHEGMNIAKINLDNKKFDLKLRLAEKDRRNVDDLKKLMVSDQRGNLIPLISLANLYKGEGTPLIKRFDFQRSKTITADINEELTTSVTASKEVLNYFAEEVSKEFPQVTLTFGGEQESTKESMSSLKDAMVLALLGIFAVLVFLFRSYIRPLIIMSTIPLGLFGMSIAFFFHNRPVSFLAMIGIIGLAGIIVNSGIVLISFIDEMRSEDNLSLDEILAKASALRLRAVVVTSLTTISGLFPTAYGIGGTDAMLIPMTLAMAWGLTSGTIFTLIWIPCAYAILEDFVMLQNKILRRFTNGRATS